MTEDAKPISVSRIRTTCEIPDATVLRWIVSLFPELADDAKLTSASNNYRGAVSFDVEHTVQAPQPAGPILLAPIGGDDADSDDADSDDADSDDADSDDADSDDADAEDAED